MVLFTQEYHALEIHKLFKSQFQLSYAYSLTAYKNKDLCLSIFTGFIEKVKFYLRHKLVKHV